MGNSLKIKKGLMVGLGSWLNEQQLSGKQSRHRTRFVADLIEEQQRLNKDQEEILNRYVEKDENGEKKKAVDNPDRWDIPADKAEVADAEYRDLMNEDWVTEITEANKDVMKSVRDILVDTDYRFGPREGEAPEQTIARIRQMNDYPIWCEAFEALDL